MLIEKIIGPVRMLFSCVSSAAALLFLIFFLFCAAPTTIRAQDSVPFPPLFDVGIQHEFPGAALAFDEVRQLILDNYYTASIGEKELYWAAIEGMLRRISPPGNPGLGKIWPSDSYQEVRRSLRGIQVSIGVHTIFEKAAGALVVLEIIPGSPAEDVLKPQDRILRIDGHALKERSPEEIETMLGGEAGTEVALTVIRDIEVFDFTLVREKLEVTQIEIDLLSDSVAYVELSNFTAGISEKLREKLTDLASSGTTGLVLDLRLNTGGVFMEALRTAELFVEQKKILLRTVQQKTALQNYVSSNQSPFRFKLAVLIGPKTASSAEIVAAAIQDHDLGVIIGEHSFGKSVVETTFPLQNDYRVKFITGAMYSPAGKSWQGTGIIPDFGVAADAKIMSDIKNVQPGERLRQDAGVITAYKLLTR